MPNKRIKNKNKAKERLIGYRMLFGNRLDVFYIVDHGDLIRDVQAWHKKEVKFRELDFERMDKYIERCNKSKLKIKHDLEYQIMSTGATRYNAEITAKKLMVSHAFVLTR